MKMKPAHFDRLEELLAPVIERAEAIGGVDFSSERNRWDALWCIPQGTRHPFMKELNRYLNDNHIDTALRRILWRRQ